MASLQNGYVNGSTTSLGYPEEISFSNLRFSDIPSALDIPLSSIASEVVEVSFEELQDDPTELCTLLDDEKAPKNFWVIVSLAYAKQNKLDNAIEVLNRGLSSLAPGATKERQSLLTWICWFYMVKSRHAPRRRLDEQLASDVKTKEFYHQAATTTLNEASRLNPAFPPLFLARGVLSILRASIKLPSNALRPGAVDTSERADALRQAVKSFEEASKMFSGRNMMAILGRARALYMLGRYADALEAYQDALVKMPNLKDPDPRIGIGCCLWQLNFKDEARAAWNRALALNPDSKVANILLSAYYLYDSARHPTNDPAFSSLYKVAMTQYAQKAFKADKESPMTCSMFAGYFLLRKAFPTVEALARKALEFTDVNAIASDAWYLLARKEHYEGDPQKALNLYRQSDQARGGEKGYLPAKFGAVQMQVKMKDYDGAKFRLEKIIQQTKNPEAMTLLGALYAQEVFEAQASGNKEDKSAEIKKAISLLESVRASWKDEKKKLAPDESVLLYLARLYEDTSQDKSMQCLSQVEQLQLSQIPESERPEDAESEETVNDILRERLAPQLLNNMGCFLYQFEKTEQARNMFQMALNACVKSQEKDDGTDTDALVTSISYNLARTYEASGMLDEAKKVYAGLLERHNDYTEANARLTYIALRQSPTDEGPKKMAKLYEGEYQNLEVRALNGWYLNKAKRRVANLAEDQEQRHHKHTLLYYDKHDMYSLTGMGNLYLLTARDMRRESDQDKEKRRKTYDRAVEFFDKALQLDSKNAYAAQGIAIALVDDRKDYSTAVQIFSKIRDTLRDASVYINLGHVYAELRQFHKSIENYEIALSKDRARDVQILTCLGRVWLLKGKQEQNLSAMKTALEYTQRARSVAPDQIHLEFNIAFVQNQIAQLVSILPETQKTSQDIEDATTGIEEAVATFRNIAKAKNPPYPKDTLEQRATMGEGTITKQLNRALQAQKEYEEKNAAKLQQAREAREAEMRRREEERRKVEEAEMEKKRQIAEERQRLFEESQKLAAQRAQEREEEEREKAMDADTDGEGKGKKKKKAAGGKRKKKDGDEPRSRGVSRKSKGKSAPESEESGPESSGDEDEEDRPAPKKRRLERRSAAKSGKYKSSEIVVESESEGEEHAENGDAESDEDEVMRDAGPEAEAGNDDVENPVQRRRKKANFRVDEDDEEEGEEEQEPAGSPAPAPEAADDDNDDLFDEKYSDEKPPEEENQPGSPKEKGDAAEDTEMKDQEDDQA